MSSHMFIEDKKMATDMGSMRSNPTKQTTAISEEEFCRLQAQLLELRNRNYELMEENQRQRNLTAIPTRSAEALMFATKYVVQKHGKTLLPQFLGLYRITVDSSETYLIVMRNILGRKYAVHRKYDLKGSTVQRQATDKEKAKELPTLKDNDFLEDNYKLVLPADAREKLITMLRDDTEFLARLHLMDYSLLVGIHDLERGEMEANAIGEASEGEVSCDELVPTPPDSPLPSTGAFAPMPSGGPDLDDEFYAIPSGPECDKRLIYFIGLVDILTYYGVKKMTASAAKAVKYGSDADNISTVKPDQYARRLVDFVSNAVKYTAEATH